MADAHYLTFPHYQPPRKPEYITWTLHPLPGMRFVNEVGGSVTIQMEKGKEEELFQELTRQLQVHLSMALKNQSA